MEQTSSQEISSTDSSPQTEKSRLKGFRGISFAREKAWKETFVQILVDYSSI